MNTSPTNSSANQSRGALFWPLITSFAIALSSGVVHAQSAVDAPALVPYTGYITQDDAELGTVNLQIELVDETNNRLIWCQKNQAVSVSKRQFHVMIGQMQNEQGQPATAATPCVAEDVQDLSDGGMATENVATSFSLKLFTEAQLFIGFKIDGTRMSLRQRLTTVPYAAVAQRAVNGVPPGTVVAYWGNEAPPGWMMCDGRAIPNDAKHAALRALVGENTPELRNYFLRGKSDARAVGSTEGDSYRSHTHGPGTLEGTTEEDTHSHTYYKANAPAGIHSGARRSNPGHLENDNTADDRHSHTVRLSRGASASSGGSETRPINKAVNYIIKI